MGVHYIYPVKFNFTKMPKRKHGSTTASRKRARSGRFAIVRRRRRRTRVGKASRGMRQSTYLFKRSITSVIPLAVGALTDGWTDAGDNGIYKQFVFNLNQLTGASQTDFTNLFKRYKIAGAKVELSFNNNASVISSVPQLNSSTVPGGQLQVYTTPNRTGRARTALNPLTEAVLMNTQAKKKRLALNGGHPLKYYMKPTQLNQIYASATNTDYAVQRAQYISTGEPSAEHYGLEMYINRVDGQALSSGLEGTGQTMRQTTTFYLAFKGVE